MTLSGVPPLHGSGQGRPRLIALPGAGDQGRLARQLRAAARGRQAHPTGLRPRPTRVTQMAKVVPLRHPVVVPFAPVGGKDRPGTGRPATERSREP